MKNILILTFCLLAKSVMMMPMVENETTTADILTTTTDGVTEVTVDYSVTDGKLDESEYVTESEKGTTVESVRISKREASEFVTESEEATTESSTTEASTTEASTTEASTTEATNVEFVTVSEEDTIVEIVTVDKEETTTVTTPEPMISVF